MITMMLTVRKFACRTDGGPSGKATFGPVVLLPILLAGVLIDPAFAAEGERNRDGTGERPNVLLIVIDDLNDWVTCLDGHPSTHTPHIDRLAQRGVLFTNAHCQALRWSTEF